MATSPHIQELLAKAKARHAELSLVKASKQMVSGLRPSAPATQSVISQQSAPRSNVITEALANVNKLVLSNLALNERQQEAIERGLRGQSFALIGAAGTGKTTVTQELIKQLQQASHMLPLADSTKWLDKDAPGFVICGFTNKAVNNIKRRLPTALQSHCITIHKLLEYAPEYFELTNEDGESYTTMRFTPSRNGANPLPHISTIIFEESSMIGTDLFGQVLDALPRVTATQFILLGDIFQLPPVFGPSILGFKMSELPVVELTHVYRQALESPIISLATAIRTNSAQAWIKESQEPQDPELRRPLPPKSTPNKIMPIAPLGKLVCNLTVDNGEHGTVTIRPWKQRMPQVSGVKTLVNVMIGLIKSGEYNIDTDQILCPFNKSFGTVEINKGIAEHLTKERNELTHEVIARFTRSYWAVGDNVLVDRHDAVITKIVKTVGYCGKPTREASLSLNRSGFDSILDADKEGEKRSVDDILNELDTIAEMDSEEGKNLASHTITVWIDDLGEERVLNTAGEINSMLLRYAITVHKSQGSEWPKVFVLLHSSHATMCSRELLYTAFTRAKQELYIVCEGDVGGYTNQLVTGAARAVIPGITLKEKIAYFKNKALSYKPSKED